MLSLTRKTDYALVALSFLGHRQVAEEGPASARLIADTYKLPLPLLMNILKELSSSGLLTSTRGATGGYVLAKEPAEISILDVIEAIEGPLRVALCANDMESPACNCTIQDKCPIRKPVRNLHLKFADFLASTSLQDLLEGSKFATDQECQDCSCEQEIAVGSSANENAL